MASRQQFMLPLQGFVLVQLSVTRCRDCSIFTDAQLQQLVVPREVIKLAFTPGSHGQDCLRTGRYLCASSISYQMAWNALRICCIPQLQLQAVSKSASIPQPVSSNITHMTGRPSLHMQRHWYRLSQIYC